VTYDSSATQTTEVLIGNIENTKVAVPISIFHNDILETLASLSSALFSHPKISDYPDLAAFAFFIRRQNLSTMQSRYISPTVRLGRGLTFHIAPSNVPVNFAYSIVFSLLAGNPTIIRVPSKNYEQVSIFCESWKHAVELPRGVDVRDLLCLVRYPRDSEFTSELSKICVTRVIWGGDKTINEMKEIKTNPRNLDIMFPDRYSISIINAKDLISMDIEKIRTVAERFFADNLTFDQNACSSARVVYWIGSSDICAKARKLFWNQFNLVAMKKFENQEKFSSSKFRLISKIAASSPARSTIWQKLDCGVDLVLFCDNCKMPSPVDVRFGLFFEKYLENVKLVESDLDHKIQTVSYLAKDKTNFRKELQSISELGADRLVPIGQALEMSLTWDGYDLPIVLSRVIEQ
jgi:hypothetical protein